jgi:hypothetical protein
MRKMIQVVVIHTPTREKDYGGELREMLWRKNNSILIKCFPSMEGLFEYVKNPDNHVEAVILHSSFTSDSGNAAVTHETVRDIVDYGTPFYFIAERKTERGTANRITHLRKCLATLGISLDKHMAEKSTLPNILLSLPVFSET